MLSRSILRSLTKASYVRNGAKAVHHRERRGFTIVELMIAISVFSVILLVCITAIMFVGRMYYKGVSLARVQEVSRTTVDAISDAVKFSNQSVVPVTGLTSDPGESPNDWHGAWCVGTKKYSYKLGIVLKKNPDTARPQSNEVFVESTDPNCGGVVVTADPVDNPRELLAENMRLNFFDITEVQNDGVGNRLTTVIASVGIGGEGLTGDQTDNGLFTVADIDGNDYVDACSVGESAAQYCAVSQLSKTVYGVTR